MAGQEQLEAVAAQRAVRHLVREYCAWTLFAQPARGEKLDKLAIPRRRVALVDEDDVYTSRRGQGDRATRYETDKLVRINRAAGYVDLLIPAAELTETESRANGAASYRAFLQRELRDAKASPLLVEHATVLEAFQRLQPLQKELLRDGNQIVDRPLSLRAVARKRGISEREVRRIVASAADDLAVMLYAQAEQKVAA